MPIGKFGKALDFVAVSLDGRYRFGYFYEHW